MILVGFKTQSPTTLADCFLPFTGMDSNQYSIALVVVCCPSVSFQRKLTGDCVVLRHLRRLRNPEQPDSFQDETFDIPSGHHDHVGHLHLLYGAGTNFQAASRTQDHCRYF